MIKNRKINDLPAVFLVFIAIMMKIENNFCIKPDAEIVVHHIALVEIIQAEKTLQIRLV